MITASDLHRLAWELNELPSGKTWCEKNGIDFEDVSDLVSFHTNELVGAVEVIDEEIDYPASVAHAIGNAFRLGWELRHQYGLPTEGDPRDDA